MQIDIKDVDDILKVRIVIRITQIGSYVYLKRVRTGRACPSTNSRKYFCYGKSEPIGGFALKTLVTTSFP